MVFFDTKTCNLDFSHVLEDGSFGKDFIIIPKKSKLKILQEKCCMSEKEFLETLPVPVQVQEKFSIDHKK